MADGAPAYEGFSNLGHGNGALDARGDAEFLESILQCERVDDCGEHPHVIARGAFDAAFAPRQAAKNISAANDDNLHAKVSNFTNLLRHVLNGFGRNSNAALPANRLTAELEQDAAIFSFRCFFHESVLQKEPGNCCD